MVEQGTVFSKFFKVEWTGGKSELYRSHATFNLYSEALCSGIFKEFHALLQTKMAKGGKMKYDLKP